MITVTEQLKNMFEANPLYSKEGQGFNAEVIARFFLPFSSAVWLGKGGRKPGKVNHNSRKTVTGSFSVIAIFKNGNGAMCFFLKFKR